MKKSRFTEEQIIGFLKQAEAGMPIKELCRNGGFSCQRRLNFPQIGRSKFPHLVCAGDQPVMGSRGSLGGLPGRRLM
uniref:transposase n=1 Tax=Hydrogenophaga sp. PML113 TaxID=1899350 RepID=UPI000AB71451